MALTEAEALRRLQQVTARVDPRLHLDQAAVHYISEPYSGVAYGLRLGQAGALLFMPEADLTAPDWEMRLFKRVEAAKHYLEEFPQARSRSS